MPFFAPFTGADAIHRQGPYVFVMRASYADEMTKILEHWDGLGADRVTVLHYDDEIGNQNYATVERIMAKARQEGREREVRAQQARGARADVQRIVAARPAGADRDHALRSHGQADQDAARGEPSVQHDRRCRSWARASSRRRAGADAAGISVSGVVPPPAQDRAAGGASECGDAMKKAGIAELNYTNLESCIAAKVLVEAMRRAGREVTRESLYRSLRLDGPLRRRRLRGALRAERAPRQQLRGARGHLPERASSASEDSARPGEGNLV